MPYVVKRVPGGLDFLVEEKDPRFSHTTRNGEATYGGFGLVVFSSDDALLLHPLNVKGRGLHAGTLMPAAHFDMLAKTWLEFRGYVVTKEDKP